MVSEKIEGLGSLKLNGYEDAGWRCINCGEIVDQVIAANRRLTSQTAVPSGALTAA
jgi:hypothetical protein